MPTGKPKGKRADGQVSGLAGEFYVAAELLKRDILASITFGSAKAIDILAYNPRTKRTFSVQVKALRRVNVFPISHARIESQHIYVFVVLNPPGTPPRYFVVSGKVLAGESHRFSKWFKDPKFPGLGIKELLSFENEWQLFEEPAGLPIPMKCCARAPNKSLQQSGTHEVLGRGRPSRARTGALRARVREWRRDATELGR